MSSINFKAQYINPVILKKKNEEGQYNDVQEAFVKLDPKDKKDMRALKNISQEWICNTIANSFYKDAKRRSAFYKKNDKYNFYAITEQKRAYNTLVSDKVLGLAYMREVGPNQGLLEYIITNPKTSYPLKERKYKNIGSSMLKSIKQEKSLRSMELYSVPEAVKFYEKNDFSNSGYCAEHLYWFA